MQAENEPILGVDVRLKAVSLILLRLLDLQHITHQEQNPLSDQVLLFGPVLPALGHDLMQPLAHDLNEFLVCEGLFCLLEIAVDLDKYVVLQLVLRYLQLEAIKRRLGQVDQQAQGYVKQLCVLLAGCEHLEQRDQIIADHVGLQKLAAH